MNIETQQELVSDAPLTPQPLVLSDEQELFLSEALDGQANILLLGKAGVGKSTTIRELIARLKQRKLNYLIAAPTGVAAINIGGQTVHRMISKMQWFSRNGAPSIDVIVVDEVSMLRADLFDRLDQALRTAMFKPLIPFGGIKLILVGDPGQLPPVVKKGDADSEYVLDNYLTPYFWSSAAYAASPWKVIELTRIFRQEGDARYPKMLNLIRKGEYERPLQWLNSYRRTQEPKGVILCGTNKDADRINQEQLSRLPGLPETFRAEIHGKVEPNEYPAELFISLKPGARVMIIKNIYAGPGGGLELVNGDVGVITEIDSGGEKKTIVFACERTGMEHAVSADDGIWEKEEALYDSKTKRISRQQVGCFTQLPVRLAWAVTIHKCQGATLQEFTLDVRRPLFAAGQAYVALSRGVSLDKLWIYGQLRPSDVQVCPDVAAFLETFTAGVGIKPGSIHDASSLQEGEKKESFEPENIPVGPDNVHEHATTCRPLPEMTSFTPGKNQVSGYVKNGKFEVISQGPIDITEEDMF